MEPQITNHLAPRLRAIRESSGLGSRVEASESTGFNKNNIASYESGQSLPPIDYLFVFADRTGADINELIRLRLACSRYESARALADTVRVQTIPPDERQPSAPQEAPEQAATTPAEEPFDSRKDLLEATLRVMEYKARKDQVTPEIIAVALDLSAVWMPFAAKYPELEARLKELAATYAFFKVIGNA